MCSVCNYTYALVKHLITKTTGNDEFISCTFCYQMFYDGILGN